MDLEGVEEILCKWGSENADIRTVYIYGSQVKGDFNESSDLDVAVELDPEQDHIDGYAFWVIHGTELEQELKLLLREYKVHLECYDKNKTPTVVGAVKNASVVAYSRDKEKKERAERRVKRIKRR